MIEPRQAKPVNLKNRAYTFCSVMALCGLAALPVQANPKGASVAHGDVTIKHGNKKTDIYQSSKSAIIDWDSFNIDQGEHTQFHQISSKAIAVNRIHDVSPSRCIAFTN